MTPTARHHHGSPSRAAAAGLCLPARLLLLCAVLLAGPAVAVQAPGDPRGAASPAPVQVQQLVQAHFVAGSGSDAAELPAQAVELPDTWVAHGGPNSGRGSYRFDITLDQVAPVLWALRIDRLSPHHELRLNGALISGGIGKPDAAVLARPQPAWIEFSPVLLRPGLNRLDVQVDYGMRAGLSTVWIGPAGALLTGHERVALLAVHLPRMLNAAGVALAIVPLLLWWRRRSERLLGGMGALLGLACLRDLSYFVTDANIVPHALGDWLLHLMQVLTAAGAVHFALMLARRDSPRVLAPLWGGAAVLTLAGVWAVKLGLLQELRTWSYPLMLVLVVGALGLALHTLARTSGAARASLLVALGLLTLASGHDYLCWRGLTSVMDVYWIPYAVPLALAATASHMIQRQLLALREVEQLNLHLEQRVAARTRELEAANQAKSRFIAAAGHDLRQPAAAIGLLVGMLREQIHTPGQREMIDRVDDAVASMENLLGGLLDLSRLEADVVQPRRQGFALQPLFDAVAAHEADSAARKGLRLRLRPTTLVVHSDRLLVEQILRNLVSNALRYTEHGGVLVAARSRGTQVELQVWDSGRGVPYDAQGAIFEEFVQLDGDAGGLGLGLAIVKRTAALLGHPLALRSRPGHGSMFGVLLPGAPQAAPALPAAASAALPLRGYHLLLLEDEPAVRLALAERLQLWGARVSACASLGELQELLAGAGLAATPPDLLLTDQRLHDGSGLAALALLRRHHPGLGALVITANTAAPDLALLADSGVPVLHKPLRSAALLDALLAALGSRGDGASSSGRAAGPGRPQP
ncbi:MAG: hypothetical protein RLZZ584_952 [Pseudomonadota bacterium]